MRIHLISLFLALISCSFQIVAQTTGADYSALAGAGSALSGSIWAYSANPAGIAGIPQPIASFTFSPAPFGMRELSESSAAVAWPLHACVIEGGYDRFGYDLFRKESLFFTVAAAFDRVRIGSTIRYHHFAISGYGASGVAGVDCGIQIHAGHSVDLAGSMTNLNLPRIGSAEEPLPQTMTVGVAYQPAGIAAVVLDYVRETGFDAAPRCGAYYTFEDILTLRCGLSIQPSLVCAGIGIRFSFWSFDYSYSGHPELGGTHECTLSLFIGR